MESNKFLRGSDVRHEDAIVSILPWLHEAGNPYFDWFFGDADTARGTLDVWMRRSTSEFYVERTCLLARCGRLVGGYLALGGGELARCRQADALAAIQTAGREGLVSLVERIREGRTLFAVVTEDDFYLSKMGVAREERGRGYGVELVQHYLASGLARGFRTFRLDVWSGNAAAIALYRSMGFHEEQERYSEVAAMGYRRMHLEA